MPKKQLEICCKEIDKKVREEFTFLNVDQIMIFGGVVIILNFSLPTACRYSDDLLIIRVYPSGSVDYVYA